MRERISKTLKVNGRRAHFIKVDRDGVCINKEAILRDEKFDGLHRVWTSLGKDHSPQGVYEHYGELWKIEESFRVMKHSMSLRPVFHWTERRIIYNLNRRSHRMAQARTCTETICAPCELDALSRATTFVPGT